MSSNGHFQAADDDDLKYIYLDKKGFRPYFACGVIWVYYRPNAVTVIN